MNFNFEYKNKSAMKPFLLNFACVYFFLMLISCGTRERVDLIIHNGNIYTVDDEFQKAKAFAVKDGRFVAVGNSHEILEKYEAAEAVDLRGAAVYPGFIDAHAHFYGYGTGLQVADLTGADSFDELIKRVLDHRQKHPEQAWVLGRGWDQNLWEQKVFPSNDKLDELFPDTPVLLT